MAGKRAFVKKKPATESDSWNASFRGLSGLNSGQSAVPSQRQGCVRVAHGGGQPPAESSQQDGLLGGELGGELQTEAGTDDRASEARAKREATQEKPRRRGPPRHGLGFSRTGISHVTASATLFHSADKVQPEASSLHGDC